MSISAQITHSSAALQEAMNGMAVKMQQGGSALKSQAYATGREVEVGVCSQ